MYIGPTISRWPSFSELDAQRRRDLLAAVANLEQVLLTTTEVETVPEEARAAAHLLTVRTGSIQTQRA